MAIETNVSGYKLTPNGVTTKYKGESLKGYRDSLGNILFANDGGNKIFYYQNQGDVKKLTPVTFVRNSQNELGDMDFEYEVNEAGDKVKMPLFPFLYTLDRYATGIKILNGEKIDGKPKTIVLKDPYSLDNSGLDIKFNVNRKNFDVINSSDKKYYLEDIKAKETALMDKAYDNMQKLAAFEGSTKWHANLKNYVQFKITNIYVKKSQLEFSPNEITVEGFPKLNKTLIIPRSKDKVFDVAQIAPFLQSFVPIITVKDSREKIKKLFSTAASLGSVVIVFELTGKAVSYDTDRVTDEGTLEIKKTRSGEYDVKQFTNKKLHLKLDTFKDIVIDTFPQSTDESNIAKSKEVFDKTVYLERASERDDYSDYESRFDSKTNKIKAHRENRRFLSLSPDAQKEEVQNKYIKNLFNRNLDYIISLEEDILSPKSSFTKEIKKDEYAINRDAELRKQQAEAEERRKQEKRDKNEAALSGLTPVGKEVEAPVEETVEEDVEYEFNFE